jgi:hypothetical protein
VLWPADLSVQDGLRPPRRPSATPSRPLRPPLRSDGRPGPLRGS